VSAGRQIFDYAVGDVVEVPQANQTVLLAGEVSKQVGADLFRRARDFPDAHFVHGTPQKSILLPNRAAQIIVIVIADRGDAARVRVLADEFAIQIELHAAWAGNRSQMDPLIRLKNVWEFDAMSIFKRLVNEVTQFAAGVG
jgi:hypothetical protein